VQPPASASGRTRRRRPFPAHLVVFLLPATAVYTVFMIYPLLDSLRLSLFRQDPAGNVFVGLQNFVTLLTDPMWSGQFWGALRNNLVFFAVHMIVQNPLGLLLAALLVSPGRGRAVYRTVIFLPATLSVVLVGFIWSLILSPLWGIAQGALQAVHLGSLFQPWLGLADTALVTMALISVWQWVGVPMLLFYVALQGVPEDLIESARIDGASGWNIFWRIRFLLILPTLGIVAILTFIGNFNAFDLIYTLKGNLAGPNFSTDLMGTFFHRTFFGSTIQPGDPTMGTTVAAMMFLIILIGVLIYLFLWQRRIQIYEL
jgi:raffinose/stachyose/melibiose transport system permease protein